MQINHGHVKQLKDISLSHNDDDDNKNIVMSMTITRVLTHKYFDFQIFFTL